MSDAQLDELTRMMRERGMFGATKKPAEEELDGDELLQEVEQTEASTQEAEPVMALPEEIVEEVYPTLTKEQQEELEREMENDRARRELYERQQSSEEGVPVDEEDQRLNDLAERLHAQNPPAPEKKARKPRKAKEASQEDGTAEAPENVAEAPSEVKAEEAPAPEKKPRKTREKKEKVAKEPRAPKEKVVKEPREPREVRTSVSGHITKLSGSDDYGFKASMMAKKIQEKAANLFDHLYSKKALSVYTQAGVDMLASDGTLSSKALVEKFTNGDKKNSEGSYSLGTARSQAQQVVSLFNAYGIVTNEGKLDSANALAKMLFPKGE